LIFSLSAMSASDWIQNNSNGAIKKIEIPDNQSIRDY
jgi:hypothetical protein